MFIPINLGCSSLDEEKLLPALAEIHGGSTGWEDEMECPSLNNTSILYSRRRGHHRRGGRKNVSARRWGERCEMLSSRHDTDIRIISSQQLWWPSQGLQKVTLSWSCHRRRRSLGSNTSWGAFGRGWLLGRETHSLLKTRTTTRFPVFLQTKPPLGAHGQL